MFTGIIQHKGRVAASEDQPFGRRLTIDAGPWSHTPARGAGESIAVNGCCLTLIDPHGSSGTRQPRCLGFDVIRQTLGVTTLGELRIGDEVNLELPATPASMLGGHIVQGHVDGVGSMINVWREPEEWRIRLQPPVELMEFIIDKGSIAVDGVSLTIAQTGAAWFEIALIPTTIRMTNLSLAAVGRRVNLETDCIARTVVTWLRRQQAQRAT
jgi:riboflavin synthase